MEQPSVLLQVVFLRQCCSWAGSGSTFQLGQVGGAGLLSQPVCCHLVQAATIKQKLSVLHYVVANCSFLALLAAATVTRLGYNYEAFRVLATLVSSSMSLSRPLHWDMQYTTARVRATTVQYSTSHKFVNRSAWPLLPFCDYSTIKKGSTIPATPRP